MENNNNMKIDIIKKKIKTSNKSKISNTCCCTRICSFLTKKCSNISILYQFIIFLIPIVCLITLALIYLELYFFDEILKFDYFSVIKDEFLRYFLTDLDDINFDLNKKKTSLLFEDVSNLVFFRIYFEEMNKYGLLDNDSEKIFSNISDLDENIYNSLNSNNSIFYSIPKNMSFKYIDSRNDSLSEIGKLYYHFYPLIATEANLIHSPVNQTYLIAYEVNNTNTSFDIIGDELYFNFPRVSDDFVQNSNFFPSNNLISPRVEKKFYFGEEDEIEFNKNWFIFYDNYYRLQDTRDLVINYFHLNENNKGHMNKTNVIIMETHLFNNNKKYVINVIFYLDQKTTNGKTFEDSVFLVDKFLPNNKKYSDNQTYVIINNEITEISLSSTLDEYFKYGLSYGNGNFFSEGVFYDNIEINKLYEPSQEYHIIDRFDFDIRFFTSFYFYTKLFELSAPFETKTMETSHINYFIFNASQDIKGICSKFNFKKYLTSLESNNVDCFIDKNLLFYSRKNIEAFSSEGLTLPYCICLPLYCIKNLNKNSNFENPDFADEIILPEKCENKLLYFKNGIKIITDNNNDEIKDLSKIKLSRGKTLDEQLEDQFIKFSYERKVVCGGLMYVFNSIIKNDDMKKIAYVFAEKLNFIEKIFTYIIIFGTITIFIFISILLLLYIHSISKVIYDYKDKAYYFLKKITDSGNNYEEKNNEKNILMCEDKNNLEIFPLLDEHSDEKYIEINELVEDLYKIYCKFYKLSENSLIEFLEKKQKKQNLLKIKTLNESNELFKLFLNFALYIPQFKLDITIDYDFFKDSKLIQNFKKIFYEKSNTNEDKEQILYTKSIIKELLSTELIDDYGFITNLNFNYMTNINLNAKNKNKNYIQIAIFKKVEEMSNKDNKDENIKIVFKYKNLIMKAIEEKFEQDEYLNLNKLKSYFNNSLIYSFYNNAKKIIEDENNY